MFIKRKITLLLTTALLSTLLFACSESNQDELMTSNQEIGGEKNSIAPSLKGNDGSSSVTSGGTLKRLWGDPPTLDPHLVTDTTSAGLVVEMFSGLVSLNSDLEIVPDLAESWDVSEGGTQYTFNLRDDIKFSDGSSVSAKDFIYSFNRAANPETESPVAELYLGDIVGAQDVIDGIAPEISGIKLIDDKTLQINIDSPKAYFLAKLTYPTAYVLKESNVSSSENWTDSPVGTGSFQLERYDLGQILILKRNEYYWGDLAKLDRVEFNLAGGVPMAMYENGEIDITGVGLADLERVQNPSDPLNNDLVMVPPSFTINYIGFNVSMPPFDDPNFRKALNYAVDKQLIASSVYSDLVRPAYGILPPNFPGFSSDIKGLDYDPDKALKFLEQSKYADPESRPPIVVTIPGTGGSPSLDMEVVADMWDRILGVQIEIQQVEWATYLQDLHRERLQVWGGSGWQADYPDPQDFIDILFHSKSKGNHGMYGNADVDKLLEEARTDQDPLSRFSKYNKAEQMIIDDAPWLPMWFDQEGMALINSRVKGFEFTPLIVPKLKNVYIQN